MSVLSNRYLELKKSSHTALKIFQNLPSVDQPPSEQKTFYLRTEQKGILTMSRDVERKILTPEKGFVIDLYQAWDQSQVWTFFPTQSHKIKGWLVQNDHCLTYRDGKFVFQPIHEQGKEDLFEYTSDKSWLHLESGQKITYSTVDHSDETPGEFKVNEHSLLEIVLARDVSRSLDEQNIFWCNTNSSEPLHLISKTKGIWSSLPEFKIPGWS